MTSSRALVLLAALSAITPGQARADVPPRLTEHGLLLDGKTGAPVTGTVKMVFGVYGAAGGGSALWTETQSVPLQDGLFSVQVGAVTPFPVGLWQVGPRFLGVRVNDDEEMLPREEVTSVAYALLAGDAVGDLHPRSVAIGGRTVIDDSGRWVGDGSGLKGDKGEAGARGEPGSRVDLLDTDKVSIDLLPGQTNFVVGDYCPNGYGVIGGDCNNDGLVPYDTVLLASAKDEGVNGGGRRWACLFRNETTVVKRISARTRCLRIVNGP